MVLVLLLFTAYTTPVCYNDLQNYFLWLDTLLLTVTVVIDSDQTLSTLSSNRVVHLYYFSKKHCLGLILWNHSIPFVQASVCIATRSPLWELESCYVQHT
jgi:hypothetical protein